MITRDTQLLGPKELETRYETRRNLAEALDRIGRAQKELLLAQALIERATGSATYTYGLPQTIRQVEESRTQLAMFVGAK